MSSRDFRSTERSPLLKSTNRAYSQTSSREEARPTDNMDDSSGVGSPLNSAAFVTPSSYQHSGTPMMSRTTASREDRAPIVRHHHTQQQNDGDDDDEDSPFNKGPMVVCRVCEAEISLEGKTNQHVVRCPQCSEVTPIRAAPPGKKYVRCPCNCLLVCKASSTRIACPRQNCRRVITLAASSPVGTAIRAPAGTCRVQCVHCLEIFMFNALSNAPANCPHCKKVSSVGVRFARSRATLFGVASAISLLILTGLIFATLNVEGAGPLIYLLWVLLSLISAYFLYRLVYFARMKVSQVLGPI